MFWLFLHFPSLQLDALHSNTKGHKTSQPIVVVEASNNTIIQLNDIARQNGISLGMGIATALSLHHDIRLIEYDVALEENKLQQIAHNLYNYSADIALCPPNGLYLRIETMLKLYKKLTCYWQTIEKQLHQFGYQFNYGVGYSALAAQILAQNSFNRITTDRIKITQYLEKLPIACLQLTNKTKQKLNRVGIKSIKQLLGIELKDLAKRFDMELVGKIGRLCGTLRVDILFYQPPPEFNDKLELMYEISNSAILQHPIKILLTQLERYLMQRNLVTTKLCFELTLRDDLYNFVIASSEGLYKQQDWIRLVILKLESIKLKSPAVAIKLESEYLFALNPNTDDLFNHAKPKVSPAELLNILQAKLGGACVYQPSLNQVHHPSLSTELKPVTFGHNHLTLPNLLVIKKTILNKNKPPKYTHLQPKVLLRPGLMLHKTQLLKEPITLMSGPERIQTNWWDHNVICRDYFIARNQQGQLYWVFRQADKRWFVQGYFI